MKRESKKSNGAGMRLGFAVSVLLVGFVLQIGCQSFDNPWQGASYEPPNQRQTTAQSVYAPMPSILPSIESNVEAVEAFGLDEFDFGDLDVEALEASVADEEAVIDFR